MANDLRIGYLSILLLSMTVYNSQIVLLRIFFVLIFSITPIFFAIQFKNNLKKNEFNYLVLWSFLCFIYVIYSLISILINSNTFSLSLVGPSAEFLTPFLIFSSPFIYSILSSSSEYVLKQSVKVFFVLLIFYLLIDLVMRYLQEPDCFMNYSCRQEAKTVGLFSTTNVIGTFVLYIFFALDRFKLPFLKYFLVIILFTGMARASIVTLIFIMMIKPIFNSNMIFKILSILLVMAFSTAVYLINPLGLFDDGSLLSKFDFLNAAFLSAQNATFLELFFGFGASFERITEVLSVQGYSPHAPYLKAYFYFGLIGVILYITLNAFFLIKNFNFFFLIILASLINGFAGAPIYNPTIWVTFALYLIYSRSMQRIAKT